jgi:hypothetical protein
MKNNFKTLCFTMVISATLAACSGNKKGGPTDSTTVDSSTTVKTSVDTATKTKRDTAQLVADTPKIRTDTPSKTVTKQTVVKKTTVKKP